MLQSFPGIGQETNPYLTQLVQALAVDVDIDFFSWRAALFGRYDVLHVHWPDRLVRGSSRSRTIARRGLFRLLMLRLGTRGTPVVRTMHNVGSHESGPRGEGELLNSFDALTSLWIRLNPFTPVPAGAAVRTIVHGHYRDWFPAARLEPSSTRRMLFFGLVRPYKGVEDLLRAYEEWGDPTVELRIAGKSQAQSLEQALTQAADRNSSISVLLRYLSEPELLEELRRARVVVLPYADFHNSGAAILALSLGRPILMPSTPVSEWLAEEVGAAWAATYHGGLTAASLAEGFALLTAGNPGEPPRLANRDWNVVAAEHVEAYLAAVSATS